MDEPDILSESSWSRLVGKLGHGSKRKSAICSEKPQSSTVQECSTQARPTIDRRCQTRAPLSRQDNAIRACQKSRASDGGVQEQVKPAAAVATARRSQTKPALPSEKSNRLQCSRLNGRELTQARPASAMGQRSQTKASVCSGNLSQPQTPRAADVGPPQPRQAVGLKGRSQTRAPPLTLTNATGQLNVTPSGRGIVFSRPASAAAIRSQTKAPGIFNRPESPQVSDEGPQVRLDASKRRNCTKTPIL